MQLNDLKAQYKLLENKINRRIKEVLDAGTYIMGPQVAELEEKLSAFSGYQEVISCASGTDALVLALKALNIGFGDEVITTAFSFFATAEAIAICGATPVFADIEEDSFNISPSLIEQAITSNTKAIIAVGLFGQAAELDKIWPIAQKYNIKLIEDAAQCFGALIHGSPSSKFCDISCTSFFPAKPLGCYGDGGACLTNDMSLAEKLRSLRVHGKGSDKYDNVLLGMNSRLDTIQAAVLLEKLEIYRFEIEKRNEVALYYTQNLDDVVCTPVVKEGFQSVWAQYSLKLESRDKVMDALSNNNISSAIYYPKTLLQQKALQRFNTQRFPVAETTAKQILSIPMHPYLRRDEQDEVISTVRSALLKQ